MCKNLVDKGNLDKPLILYNRTKKRSDHLAASLGADKTQVVDTVNVAVKSADIIFMCLGDDAAVNSTVDVILKEDVKGKLIVDASTVHPDTTNALEKRVTEKGAEFVGMPVFGGMSRPNREMQFISPSHKLPPWPTQEASFASSLALALLWTK